MAMQTDVKSAHLEVDGPMGIGRTRVKGVVVSPGATASDLILRDGTISGPIMFQVNVTGSTVVFNVTVPGEGILFYKDVHVTLPTDSKVTVFYG